MRCHKWVATNQRKLSWERVKTASSKLLFFTTGHHSVILQRSALWLFGSFGTFKVPLCWIIWSNLDNTVYLQKCLEAVLLVTILKSHGPLLIPSIIELNHCRTLKALQKLEGRFRTYLSFDNPSYNSMRRLECTQPELLRDVHNWKLWSIAM
jgi:hypothetical protein